MTLEQIKRDCGDCRKTHRWAEIVSKSANGTFRVVGVGRKYVRLMSAAGVIFNANANDIQRAW